MLRVEHRVVDFHVEDSAAAGHEGQFGDDVLVVVEEITSRAHGAVEIVSGHAVGDSDLMPFHAFSVPTAPAGYATCAVSLRGMYAIDRWATEGWLGGEDD